MKPASQFSQWFAHLILVASLALFWFSFAPFQLGGQVSYVLVNGISMEPKFHTGDMVIARKAADYQIGDVVTYRDPEMQAYVIHRIIAKEDDNFTLQGDNNSWVDAHRPTRNEILGKLWLHLPQWGKALLWLRQSFNLTISLVLFGGVLMATTFTNSNRRKRATSWGRLSLFEMSLYLTAISLVLFFAFAVFAFWNPAERPADGISYQQTGVFFYSALGGQNVYDTSMARSGEPVFPRLTCALNIGFVYSITAENLRNVTSDYQITAQILDEQSGWQRTIPLARPTSFQGDTFSSLAVVDLCQVQTLVGEVEQQTGFRPSTYTLSIRPRVLVSGEVQGSYLQDFFEASLEFKFDKVHFYLAERDVNQALSHSETRKIQNPLMQENRISLAGFSISVPMLRVFSGAGLGISLLMLVVLGVLFYSEIRNHSGALAKMKYGHLMIDIYEYTIEPNARHIEVTTIDELAKLAERQNSVILHLEHDQAHYYFVQANGSTYRYVLGGR